MDNIESDDSECWEDFFGSSTDLTPSLIGLYDTLTGSFNGENNSVLESNEKPTPPLPPHAIHMDSPTEAINITKINQQIQEQQKTLIIKPNQSSLYNNNNNNNINNNNKYRTFRVLSPNVQRIISNASSIIDKSIDCQSVNGICNNSDHNYSLNCQKMNINKKQTNKYQPKSFNIPLSKNTCKLTQCGTELVETFNSSCEYLMESNKDIICRGNDNDLTPTNEIQVDPMTRILNEEQHSNNDGNSLELDASAIESNGHLNEIKGSNLLIESELPTCIQEIIKSIDSISFSDDDDQQNSSVNSQKTRLGLSSSNPHIEQSEKPNVSTNEINNKQNSESLDELTDIKSKFSPKEGRRTTSLFLPENAKLKHRPLSTSSLSSTSSGSSSGSDHLNDKLNTSYLASVESLADHTDLDVHSNLTVFERSCLEIVETERSYCEDLRQIIHGYLEDWRERACLKVDELKILFSNIEDIYEFNVTFLKQLINSGMDPIKLAKCFINFRANFGVYTVYCTSYPEAISMLTTLLQASHTNSLLTSTQKMLQHTLPLGSYLLKPVQRILKYHLLLANLLKYCDVVEVVQAYEIMREVAKNIDQVKKKLEQQSRVKELSGILDGWLGPEFTVLGELLQEGMLLENNKHRMVFLFETMLIIAKPKEDNRLQFKSYIYGKNLMLREHLPGEQNSFNVIPYHEPRSQIKFTAKNREQKRLWATNIKAVILKHFDIPNRAKELVYQLGDEEDRTPDKNTWKWGNNSSTPVYLERRNQYRRSEMRSRSKIKRKTLASASSVDTFKESTYGNDEIIRNHSMDDNMIQSMPKVSDGTFNDSSLSNISGSIIDNSIMANDKLDRKSKKMLKERSKSVPRHSTFFGNKEKDDECNSLQFSSDDKSSKTATDQVEIKQYNSKTIPKRIANLKKNRNRKENPSSKFYLDISEMDNQTVLKITESTESLNVNKDTENTDSQQAIETDTVETTSSTPINEQKSKKDAEIISDLLKEHKEFERIYHKPQKKRSLDNVSLLSSPDVSQLLGLDETPPRPPSRSPPPLEDVEDDSNNNNVKKSADTEHIYESLLRNVHVPYKYSPVLNRSKSQQYYTSRIKNKDRPRPESDYVTLVYSQSGNLEKIDDDPVKRAISTRTDQLRNSDSKINYHSVAVTSKPQNNNKDSPTGSCSSFGYFTQTESSLATTTPSSQAINKHLIKKFKNVSSSQNSLVQPIRKSSEASALVYGRYNKPPERRVSDVTDMRLQSFIHRQGSDAVGERMANVDYADPRVLFKTSSAKSSIISLKPQRDSVFSLTSSNDSVCESNSKGSKQKEMQERFPTQFTYEDNVEACLENDFRDSAIYSDDNEKRYDCLYESSYIIHKSNGILKNSAYVKYPQIPPKPLVPPKSPPILSKTTLSPLKETTTITSSLTTSSPKCIIAPPNYDSSRGRSWVLQQIQHFEK